MRLNKLDYIFAVVVIGGFVLLSVYGVYKASKRPSIKQIDMNCMEFDKLTVCEDTHVVCYITDHGISCIKK